MTPADIRKTASEELERELFREQVEQEKARLRTQLAQPWWERLFSFLPFTITVKRKPK